MTSQLESLRRYVAHRAPVLQPEAPDRVLLVGSGKGGVGTSTVAALLAVMAAADGHDVLLVDADESHGTLPLLFGIEPHHSLSELRGGDVAPSDLLLRLGPTLALVAAGGDGEASSRLEPAERRAMLRRVASLYDRFDLVIVDTGSRLEQVLAAASVGGSRLLAVTAPERVSAAATYALVKVLDSAHGDLPIDLVFNRCRLAAASSAFDEVDSATRHFLRRSIGFAGSIPEDQRLGAEIESGTPIQDAAGLGTPATAAAHDLAGKLASQITDVSHAVSEPRLFTRR